jgi:serine O-acetyltransferase
VVIGATTIIGQRVKLYQGVTLGALSFSLDDQGNVIRTTKRHPTLEDDVVIYAGATVLGGDTTIGQGSVIGGSCWITKSVPPYTRVIISDPKMRYFGARAERPKPQPGKRRPDPSDPEWCI